MILRRFGAIFAAVLVVFLLANLVAARLQSDCGLAGVLNLAGCADDISRAGFPWVFWEEGGFAYQRHFDSLALGLDVGLALAVALVVGWLGSRARQPRGTRTP